MWDRGFIFCPALNTCSDSRGGTEKKMSKNTVRDSFTGKFGFILACVGSAVGMGNIWLFPRRVAAFGAPFLVAYLVCVVIIGLSGVIGEMAYGRAMKAGPMGAFAGATEKAGRGRLPGSLLSAVPVLSSLALAIGYSVVSGWILKYTVGAFTGSILSGEGVGDFGNLFGYTATGTNNLVFHLAALAITYLILVFGISKGVEKADKFFMPLFFLMFIGIAIYVSTLDGAAKGYAYMFTTADWSGLLNGNMWKYALGQAFFSLSLAGGGTLVYGSYLGEEENIPYCASMVAIFDTLAAFVAALAIIPAVYAAGIDMAAEVTSGPGLMFIYLPYIFKGMGSVGPVISIIFFVAVCFAAFSSLINLFEAPIEALQNSFGMKRVPAVSLVLVVGAVVAVLISDIVSGWMDVCSIYLCPIGALMAAVMFFWVCGRDFAADEINRGHTGGHGRLFANMGKYVFCTLSILVLILGSITTGGIG